MSFKQAKELTERFELAGVSLDKTLANLDIATKRFESTLQSQKQIMECKPKADEKINIMKMIVALNIGFILGIVFSKYIG